MSSAESDVTEPLTKCPKINRPEETQQLDTTPIFPILHEDIVVSILQWLPVKNLIQLEMVSQHWKDKVIPRTFMLAKIKAIDLGDFIKEPREWRHTIVAEDNIGGFDIFKKLLDLMGSQLNSVSLKCADSRLGPEELQLLTTKCPHLSHLEISGSATHSVCIAQLPSTVVSLNLTTAIFLERDYLDPAHLEVFLRSHPGLKHFRLITKQSVPELPQWLAQYCAQLTQLSLAVYGQVDWQLNFSNVFTSLTHLKELDLSITGCFNAEELENLCVNCPNLEILTVNYRFDDLTLAGARLIGGLKKLKRLGLWHRLTDECVAALCEGVGAQLDFLQLHTKLLTNASLRAISLHCHNLSSLRLIGPHSFSQPEMTSLIDKIISHPSWTDPANKRNLIITVFKMSQFDQVYLNSYADRVEFANW